LARGGSRKGSGRKSKPYRFLEVGAFCENLSHKLMQELIESRIKESSLAYNDVVSKARSKGIKAYKKPKTEEQEDHHENIEEALLRDRKKEKESEALLDKFEAGELNEEKYLRLKPIIPRYRRIKKPRPQRQLVLEQASKHFRLKKSTIDKYWKQYRASLKD
jgi:hypothetical protein